jgi:hypothetical protein
MKGALSPAAAILLQRGISLAQVARACEPRPLSRGHVSDVLRGERPLSPAIVSAIDRVAGREVTKEVLEVLYLSEVGDG